MNLNTQDNLEESNASDEQANIEEIENEERKVWPASYIIDQDLSLEDIFVTYYNKMNKKYLGAIIRYKKDITKNLRASIFYFNMGSRNFEEGNYMEALYAINGCIIYAPTHHEIFGVALKIRSEIFFRLEKYKECLSDIEVIPTTKCPKQFYYKIYIRKCCALRNLGAYLSAWRALGEAEDAYQRTDPRNIPHDVKDIKEKLSRLEVELRLHLSVLSQDRVSMEEIKNEPPPLLNGENDKFVGASNAVKLMENNRLGRYVVATESIEPGSVLFVEEPYSVSNIFGMNQLTIFCSNCLKMVAAFIPCHGCLDSYYCSLKCREFYWNTRHKWDCVGMRKRILNPMMSLALGTLFRASFSNFPTETTADVFGDKADNYAYIRTLITNKEKIPDKKLMLYLKMAGWMVVYLKTCTDFFEWLQNMNPRQWGSTRAMHRTIGGFLLTHLLQIDYNAEKIGDCVPGSSVLFCQGFSYQYKTLALYVSTRMIGHACMPNAVVRYEGSTKIVQAIRNIEPGEEVTVSYFSKNFVLQNHELPTEYKKRSAYLERYLIDCHCLSCDDVSLHRRLYSWKCIKCANYSISDETSTRATCLTCGHEFDLNIHKMIENSLEKRFHQIRNRPFNEHDLKDFEGRMANIYHSTNLNFLYLYAYYANIYEYYEVYEKVIEYIKKVANLRLLWFGYTDEIFSSYIVYLSITYVKLYLSIKDIDVYNSNFEELAMNEVIFYLKNATDTLKYHMSQENISAFEKTVLDILNSPIYIHASQIENIVFYACSKTPIPIKLFDNPDMESDEIPIIIAENIVSDNNSQDQDNSENDTENSDEQSSESDGNSDSENSEDDSENTCDSDDNNPCL